MDGHGGSSAGSYRTDPTSPIPPHCVSIVATSTLRVNKLHQIIFLNNSDIYMYLIFADKIYISFYFVQLPSDRLI